MKVVAIFILGSTFIQFSQCANILFFFQVSTYSHRIPVDPLMDKLADRGHNVTFFHPYKQRGTSQKNDSKVHEFLPQGFEYFEEKLQKSREENLGDFLKVRLKYGRFGSAMPPAILNLPSFAYSLCDEFLSSPDVIQFIESSTFDLIVIDALYNECAYGLAHKFGGKTIIFSTSVPWPWHYEPFGIVQDTTYLTEHQVSFPIPMNFAYRLITTAIITANYFFKQWFAYPRLQELFQRKLNISNMPSVSELEEQTSLVLYNSHFSEEVGRSLSPMYVAVGGLHCDHSLQQNPRLFQKFSLKDIKNFIHHTGEKGFVYVSFGSEAKISGAPPEFQRILFEAFTDTNVKFLFKWEGQVPSEMPSNVFTAKWIPQKEVLAHKNCKAFITHGGLMSIQEAITHGVPMIVFPIFAEQDMNAFRVKSTGRGIYLEASTVTVEELRSGINEILTNKMYKENVLKASAMFKDRPQKPLDTAVYWTEYVLRHDTSIMKPPTMEMYWFQRRLLDVWAFIVCLFLSILYLSLKIFLKLFSSCFLPNKSLHKLKLKRS